MMLVGMGKMFVNSGLTTWFQSFLTPVFSGLGVFAAIFLLALSAGVLSNAMPYGTSGLAAVYSTILAPVLMAMGYNAVLMMMPAIFMLSQMFCLSAHPTVMCSYMFGWYEDKDLVLPGIILVVFEALLFSVFTYFLGPVLWNTTFIL